MSIFLPIIIKNFDRKNHFIVLSATHNSHAIWILDKFTYILSYINDINDKWYKVCEKRIKLVVLWWDCDISPSNIEYYDIQYGADSTINSWVADTPLDVSISWINYYRTIK